MKTFDKNMIDIGLNEARMYRRLRNNNNFVKFLCTFTVNETFNILLEQGECDLFEYFQLNEPPVLRKEIIEFWSSLVDVVSALESIHYVRTDGVTGHYLGFVILISLGN